MITEIFLQLLKQEAANILQVGSDRVKCEFKQIDYNTIPSAEIYEKIGLFFILSASTRLSDEGLQSLGLIMNDIEIYTFTHDGTIMSNSNLDSINLFCEKITLYFGGSKYGTLSYLSFEKF